MLQQKMQKPVNHPTISFWDFLPLPTQTELKVCDSCLCFDYLFQDLKVQNHILEKQLAEGNYF